MKKQLLRFTLYAIIVYLTVGTLNPPIAASHPLGGHETHFFGVIDGQRNKRYAAQFPNRNYARTFAANLNVGEPYTVRLIYFLPSGREPRPNIDAEMDALIKRVQQFCANQMEHHGFGRKTFRIETDATGKAVVHHVAGQFTAEYYEHSTFGKVIGEIREQFDTQKNIYLVVVDSGHLINGTSGLATLGSGAGGVAMINRRFPLVGFYLAAHELGHTFGLGHDIRNDGYVMSYGSGSRLSYCAAEGLDASRFFNSNQTTFNEPTIVQILPPNFASPPNAIRLRFEVTDVDGLYQARLLTPEVDSHGGLIACKRLNGTSSTVEFVTTELTPKNESVFLRIIDVHGNISWSQSYPIDVTSLLPPPEVVSIPDTNLAATVRETLGLPPGIALTSHTMLNLITLNALNRQITDLTGLEHSHHLRRLDLDSNKISNFSSLEGLTQLKILILRGSSLSDISSLSDLTQLSTLHLSDNSISDISSLSGLTQLNRLDLDGNSISDISSLSGLTQLNRLDLDGNSISDISSLSGLTQLLRLYLSGNSISDISSLSGLTQLTVLYLFNNSISDISALAGLTQLTVLYLSNNSISDISALAGLTQLTHLYLRGNPLSYPSINTHIPAMQAKGIEIQFDDESHPALLKISGDNQKGASFAPLSQPFTVEAQNAYGSELAGLWVVFTVTAGGGTLSTTITRTDENGRAQSTLTLGPHLGTNTVSVSATSIESSIAFHAIADKIPTEYFWAVPEGISLIHLPLKVTTVDGIEEPIQSVSGLYDALGGANSVNLLATGLTTQGWRSYVSVQDRGTSADTTLTDDTGIIAVMNDTVSLRLSGDPLGTNGHSSITLHPGPNLVGVPLRDSRITRVSDLFTLDGIRDNVLAITVADNGRLQMVRQAGDAGDIPVIGGQSFVLMAQTAATVAILGDGWYNRSGEAAAAPVAITGIQMGDTTPILALRGSIVPPAGGWGKSESISDESPINRYRREQSPRPGMPHPQSGSGFRVTVKNLSTDRKVATVTAGDEADYRLTVVDLETERAVQVGDILEISVQSPSALIGVEPVRYTVTVEDVKRSLIQLPVLVAYEIPSETELLANYPNPFNPETWIPYRLAEDAFVTLTIYDTAGQFVRNLDVGHRTAAAYESQPKAIHWDGKNNLGEEVASGIYFYTLRAGDYSATRKMVILK